MAAFDVEYYLDDIPLSTYGIIVTTSKGLIGKPAAKDTLSADWTEHNGIVRDLANLRYKGREIELTCVMEAGGYQDFITKITSFLQTIGTKICTLSWKAGNSQMPNILVAHSKQLNVSKEFDPKRMVGTFQLKFEELIPPVQKRKIVSYITPDDPTDNDVHYYIDGQDIAGVFGVFVESSSGLFQKPQEKESLTVDWYGKNGVEKDVSSIRYDEREIALNCFITAKTYDQFISQVQDFCNLLTGTGSHRLRVKVRGCRPLVYEVYHPSQITISPEWNEKTCVGTFTLKLVEPEPVKIVLSISGNASIRLASKSAAHIYWGDGTHTFDVSGDGKPQTITKTLPEMSEVIIAVETKDLIELTHNGSIIWNRLV